MQRRVRMILALLVAGSISVACNDGSAPRPRATATPSSLPSVLVALQEFSISATPGSVARGKTTFQADNKGPKLKHQLVIANTTLGPADLPTKADGTVDESKLDIVGRIAALAPKMSTSTIFTLASGKYVLFCNLVSTSGGRKGPHYKLGMRTAFAVA